MSLKLNERYPGRFDNPSADYPQGSFKNRTSPTAKDGSYLEKDWANDKEGFFQSLIAVAGIAPSGTADKVGASQYYDALLSVLYSAARKTPVLTDTGTAGIYAAANTPALTTLPSTGYMQRVKISNLNPGASTYSPDGLAAKPIYGLGLQPLQGGELPAGVAVLMYLVQAGVNGGNGAWIIVESLGGASQIPLATKSQHAMQLGQAVGRLIGVQMFSTVGTFIYTPTAGTNSVVVEVQGGGGGGGSSANTTSGQYSIGSAAAGGGYAKSRLTTAFSGATVVVGAGGTGGTVATQNAGTGGTSSFGASLSATGGFGGSTGGIQTATSYLNPLGTGGVGIGGNICNISGGPAPTTICLSATAASATYSGSAVLGSGVGASSGAGSGSTPVQGYGGGGSAAKSSNTTGNPGGNGAQGIVIIFEYA